MIGGLDLSEVDDLVADMLTVGPRIAPPVRAAVGSTASSTQRDAKRFAPVLTGTLSASITATISGDGMSSEVGPEVEYGGYVEYGTSDTAPQPFMGPAAEANEEPFVKELELAADVVLR